jgi:hypothetical protein
VGEREERKREVGGALGEREEEREGCRERGRE